MELKKVALNELVSPEYNPREISDEEMAKLKRSITELGYSEPIIVNDVNNVIISGNQRYKALKELGTDEIEVIYIHEPVPAREKALNIALNKIDGEWDNSKLVTLIDEIDLSGLDLNLTGFEDYEITEINLVENIEFESDWDLTDDDLSEDEKPSKNEVTCPYCNEKFIVQ